MDLAAPNMEALRLLGGADGSDGEESDHFASGGLPSMGALAAARRADRLRVKAHVGGPGAARRPWRAGVAESRGVALQRPDRLRPARTGPCSDRGLPQ